MKLTINSYLFFLFSILVIQCYSKDFYAQSESKLVSSSEKQQQSKKLNSTQSSTDGISIIDPSNNTLIKFHDEGTFGSIEIPIGTPTSKGNKLYNVGGQLHADGQQPDWLFSMISQQAV